MCVAQTLCPHIGNPVACRPVVGWCVVQIPVVNLGMCQSHMSSQAGMRGMTHRRVGWGEQRGWGHVAGGGEGGGAFARKEAYRVATEVFQEALGDFDLSQCLSVAFGAESLDQVGEEVCHLPNTSKASDQNIRSKSLVLETLCYEATDSSTKAQPCDV